MTDRMTTLRRLAGIETLATRKSDSMDFKEVAVWSIEAALQDAYAAGLAAAKKG